MKKTLLLNYFKAATSRNPRKNTTRFNGLLALFVMVMGMGVSWGQLLQWNTFGNAGTETTESSVYNATGINTANLTLGSGVTAAANSNRFGGSNWWKTGNSTSNTLAQAITANSYIEFTVTPTAGYSFTPTSFVFGWDRSNSGPANVTLRSSVDSYASSLGTVTGMAAAQSNGNTITISGLTNLTTATTFRLFGYSATATGGTGGFDVATNTINVVLNGTVSSTDANLSGLTISSGTLAPTFASGTTAYTASVSNATSTITVTPTRNEANATIQARVNGGSYSTVTSGSASGPLALIEGDNTISVKVTAQDGSTTKTYSIAVTREGTTWNGTAWSNGAPISTVDVVINGDYTENTDISCKDLTINSGKTLTIQSGNSLTVAGNLVNNGTIVFKSENSGTARFGQFSGTISGSGNVTVERYLPAKRGWRLLTAPLKGSSSNTVASNWQGTANEGLLLFSPATYQTQTMTGYTTGGGSPNIWKYNSASTQWQSIADISTENLFSSTVNNGFLVFATGPSNSSNIASGSTDTTLKPVGQLITGSVPYSLTANKYYLIGNPYASPLNTETMVQANPNSKAYLVDPSLSSVGGYVTFDGSNWSVLPSGSDKYIQSGQGFFLKSTTGGTFTIAETHKVSGNTNTWFQRTTTDTSADKIRVMLYKQSNSTWQLADGILAVNSASGNDEVDAVDTDKMSNFNENLLFKNGTSNLAIEYRGLPAAGTLQPLQLTGTSAQGYELRIKTENYSNSNLTPYLENTQTGALTAIPTDGSEVAVPFTGIAATTAAPDTRFRIVYQSALHLEDTNSLAVGVYPNPVNEGLFTVVVPQANTPASYTLTNLLGQEVQKGTLLTTNNSIQVQPLTPGVYLLQVNQEGKQYTTKIMIN